jgi:hypothetical protein
MDIGVIEEDHSSKWASICPKFVNPKKTESNAIRVVKDFR